MPIVEVGHERAQDADAVRVGAGEERRARGRADGLRHVEVGEPHALAGPGGRCTACGCASRRTRRCRRTRGRRRRSARRSGEEHEARGVWGAVRPSPQGGPGGRRPPGQERQAEDRRLRASSRPNPQDARFSRAGFLARLECPSLSATGRLRQKTEGHELQRRPLPMVLAPQRPGSWRASTASGSR